MKTCRMVFLEKRWKSAVSSTQVGRVLCLSFLFLLALRVEVLAKDYTYTTKNGMVTITRYSGAGGAISIPEMIDGLPVTCIGNGSFQNCDLTGVKISANVTSIGGAAFASCKRLTSVEIPIGVVSIGSWAFSGCHGLSSVMIPAGVTNITAPFPECDNLTNILVDTMNSAYSSLDGVLCDNNRKTIVQYPAGRKGGYSIPDGVTTIEFSAFRSCTGLTSVNVPRSVVAIRDGAFLGCDNLDEIGVVAENSRYTSVDGVLYDKSRATLVQCPGGKTGSYAVPNCVKRIGNMAFGQCSKLTSVTIPESVSRIGHQAFSQCANLNSITVPDSVSSVELSVFEYCYNLTNAIIGNSVKRMGPQTFQGCRNLTSVTIGAGVPSIGNREFHACRSLTSISIPAGVTNIDPAAFGGYSSCTAGSVGRATAYIGGSLSEVCRGLIAINVDDSNACFSSQDGVLYNKNKTALIFYPMGRKGDFAIQAGVTSIGMNAFLACGGLTSVTLPSSVTNIGVLAFADCRGLAKVFFKGNAPVVAESAFKGDGKTTVYYLAGTTGWGPKFGGRPTELWNP